MEAVKLLFHVSHLFIYIENKEKKSKVIELKLRKYDSIYSPYKSFYHRAIPKLLLSYRYEFLCTSGFVLTHRDVTLKRSMLDKIRNLKLL
jgi:hypothetical protein